MSAIPNKPSRSGLGDTLYRLPIPWKQIFTYLAALVALIYLAGPFAWIVISSFMTSEETMSVPPHWIPHEPTLMNYSAYWNPEVLNNLREERRLTVGGVV